MKFFRIQAGAHLLLTCYLLVLSPLCSLSLLIARDLPLDKIKLPPGFKIEIFAHDVPNARSLCLSPKGTLFVGTQGGGSVYAVVDSNADYRADKVYTLIAGLNMPNGVAFRQGDLYVAEVNRVIKFSNIETMLEHPPKPTVINNSFPRERHHGWKFIRFSPDGLLYVPVGAPCNICDRGDPYASIMRMKSDGSELEVFARGVRNSVGFDWHPETGELWFTDNGRDMLGDDLPPDELNRAPRPGMHFGYPYRHGRNIADPEYGDVDNESRFTMPAQELGPHVASLGMRFYRGEMFPQKYRKQIFIAEHGSWNRGEKIGYRITLVRLDGNNAVSYETFAEGWLQADDSAWGRPVDLEISTDGSMLVSDDQAGVIYRIIYESS
jgi:glucose/arabinose dehydrogenase